MSIASTIEDAIPGFSQVKLILGGVMALALVGFALWVVRVNHLRATYKANWQAAQQWQADVRRTTSNAAHIAKNGKPALLALDQVQPQIVYLGQAVTDLNAKVGEQNAAITAMAASSAAKISAGNAALAKAEKAGEDRDKTAADLRASAAGNTAKTTCVGSVTYLKHSGDL